MTRNTRFYFLFRMLLLSIILLIGISFLKTIMIEYLKNYEDIFLPIFWIFNLIRTLSIIAIIAISIYIIYVGGVYLSSRFYMESKIPVHEALFHGYIDLAYVYSRLVNNVDKIDYDTKSKSILIHNKENIYIIIVRDIFGRLEANPQNETWYVVSKKRKQFGKIKYMKRRALPNPLYEETPFEHMDDIKGKEIHKLVCLTGLRINRFENDKINTVYEIENIIT